MTALKNKKFFILLLITLLLTTGILVRQFIFAQFHIDCSTCIEFTASPTTIYQGESSVLTLKVDNTPDNFAICSIAPGVISNKSLNDGNYNYTVWPCGGDPGDFTYTVNCLGGGGAVNDSLTINCCTLHAYYQCYNDDVYWYDSCDNREELKQDCQATCFPGVLGNGCEAGTYQCPAGSDICIGLQPCSPPQYTGSGTVCECNTDEGTVLKICNGSGNCLATEEVCDSACGADAACQGLEPGDSYPGNPFKSCCQGGWHLPKWREISP